MNSSLILVINSGSSSLKFALVQPESGEVPVSGVVEHLGCEESTLQIKFADGSQKDIPIPGAGLADALEAALSQLNGFKISAVGHRVVQGGEKFSESVVVDDAVEATIAAYKDIAPLHAEANEIGIRITRKKFPELKQVAVFDTAFHHTLPPYAYTYAIPHEWYERYRVRKYGFHGTSHRYVSQQAARLLKTSPENLHLITAHLGNGASACAVRNGKSVDTSMGFTPLEGLVMGTRSGDIDANVLLFIHEKTGLSLSEITDILNKKSGLLGLSGISNDMRTLLAKKASGDSHASLAVEVFCYRLAKHVLALSAALDRIDALIFTGGIGENSSPVRQRTLEHLRIVHAVIDPALNAVHGFGASGRITSMDSKLLALVVPTHEELVIAQETARLLKI